MAPKVIKISQVIPAATNSLVIPLTFFDLRWLKLHPSQRVIFFKLGKEDSSRESFHSVILPKLESSLSLVLRHYLPLVGRLTWNQQDPRPCIVVLPNDSVSLTVTESDADFVLVSGKGLRPETEIRFLVPQFMDSCDESPSVFSLQVTYFPNQGFSIGISVDHSVMDGVTTVMFIKSWAHICKHKTMTLPQDLTPVLDRNVINVPTSLDAKVFEVLMFFSKDKNDDLRSLKLPPIEEIGADVVRITLQLTLENVERLKERAKRESCRSELHLSTFVVAYAYLWTCLVKTRGGDEDRPVRLMYTADFRNRLEQPVPETYFGNCVFPIGCFGYDAKVFLGEDGFVNTIDILSDSVKGISSKKIEEVCELYLDGTKSMKPGTKSGSIAGRTGLGHTRWISGGANLSTVRLCP